METQIYHYKSQGEWISFSLEAKHAEAWNNFCKKIAFKNPDDPYPYYDDYLDFMKSLKYDN